MLYEPADGKPVVNIIFVHGLQGHPKDAWTSKKRSAAPGPSQRKLRLPGFGRSSRSKLETDEEEEDDKAVFWPEDLLPTDCPNARIWTWGYDSHVTHFFNGATNQNNIFGHAKNLLFELNREIDFLTQPKAIFVAHSLGGIIVKEVLRRSEGNEDVKLRSIFTATYGVVFLGTPHRGSNRLAKQIRALQFDSSELELSREEFAKQWRRECFLVRTFQEGQGMKGTRLGGFNEKVVPDISSSLDDPRERPQHINKNHVDMCKFGGAEDLGYRQVCGELKEFVRDIDRQLLEQNKLELLQAEEASTERSLNADEKECLRSLCFPQTDSRYQGVKPPQEYTCGWLFESRRYHQLRKNRHGMLWLKGPPGSAKSTLMKQAVKDFETLQKAPDALMAKHFFNARGVALEKNFLGLLRSLLHQLLVQVRPMLKELLPTFYECDESERQTVVLFLEKLMQTARTTDAALKIFFSSRPFPKIDIEACEEIHPEDFNGSDISVYVERRLSRLPDEKGVSVLKEEIVKKAQGVFLWVVLVIDILTANKYEPLEVKQNKLRRIPPDLSQLYKKILEGMTSDERENMCHLIQWVLFAERPLTPQELLTAMAFDHRNEYPSFSAWRESGMFIGDQSQIDGLIRARSRGLIEVKRGQSYNLTEAASEKEDEPQTGIAQFIHESAREFFLLDKGALAVLAPSLGDKFVGRSHDRLARSCINYLSIEELRIWCGQAESMVETLMSTDGKKDHLESEDEVREAQPWQYEGALRKTELAELPFQSYASEFVFVHAQHAESNNIQQTHLVNLFDKKGRTPLHLTAWGDHQVAIRLLLDKGADIQAQDKRGQTPLHSAVYEKNKAVIRLLLDKGADVDAQDKRGQTPLYSAVYGNNEVVIRLLLDKGADIHAQDGGGQAPLHLAVWKDNKAAIRLLLDKEADIQAQDKKGRTPLHLAAWGDHQVAIRLLLDKGADIQAQDKEGRTPLHLAVCRDNKAAIRLLLEKGADINVQDEAVGTPLHSAVSWNREAVTQLLLADPRTKVNATNKEGWTALHLAAFDGYKDIVRLLLTHGADIEAREIEGRTALQLAMAGKEECMEKTDPSPHRLEEKIRLYDKIIQRLETHATQSIPFSSLLQSPDSISPGDLDASDNSNDPDNPDDVNDANDPDYLDESDSYDSDDTPSFSWN
ncbi:hypothetical protein MMC30_007473 [Trapelia coarctata]|nr:hypothetical protein [Trapelia coarctata]